MIVEEDERVVVEATLLLELPAPALHVLRPVLLDRIKFRDVAFSHHPEVDKIGRHFARSRKILVLRPAQGDVVLLQQTVCFRGKPRFMTEFYGVRIFGIEPREKFLHDFLVLVDLD